MYDNYDLQSTSCENVLGVHIDDDNSTLTIIFNTFQKRYRISLTFVSDKIIPFFTTQSVILQCLY